MRARSHFLGFAVVLGLGACGDDTPYVPKDGGPDAAEPAKTLTTFVIDLVQNHSSDQTPAAYSDFKDLPDPDGDNNTTTAYDPLFH
jgi:hypothetical protein